MAIPKIKATYSLDAETVGALERVARRWGVSKSEVIHTNFLIRAVGGRSAEAALLETWLLARHPVAVSSITWAEFLCGPVAPAAVRVASEIVGAPVAFGAAQAVLAADCFNVGGRRRGSMGDCMIAATAIAASAALATANVADFQRFAPLGLRLAT